MFAFFDGLVEFLSTAIDFIINFFASLVHFFLMVVQSLAYISACISYLPPFLGVFVAAIVALAVIINVLNHGG